MGEPTLKSDFYSSTSAQPSNTKIHSLKVIATKTQGARTHTRFRIPKKHGLGFADAWKVFAGAMVLIEDDREDYGEQLLLGIGLLEVLVVVVVHTEGNGTIRVISMREAERHEKDRYYLEAGV